MAIADRQQRTLLSMSTTAGIRRLRRPYQHVYRIATLASGWG